MSIENLLAENTAAVKALTEAINALISSGIPVHHAAAQVPAAPVSASAPAQVPAPVSAPAAVSAPAPAQVPAAPAALTLPDVRAVCVRAGQAGLTQEVVSFLAAHGVKLLTDLDPQFYPELLAALAVKGVK
jgi:hypothetical protein